MKRVKLNIMAGLLLLSGFVYGQNDREARGKFIQDVLYKAETATEKEKAYKELIKKWPPADYGENDLIVYDYAIGSLTRMLAEEGRTDDALRYLGDMKERFWRAQGYSPVADILLRQGDTVHALPLIRTALDDARYYIGLPEDQKDNKAKFAAVGYPGYVGQLVGIHLNRGEYGEAISVIEEAVAVAPDAAARFSGPYARSLEAAGRKLEALQQLEMLYRQGEFNHKDKMESLYTTLNGSGSGFGRYLSRLHVDVIKSIREHIAGQAQYKDAPDFDLLNLKGERVSLASLRGKVVVLDFWATWCQPCIRSFPGMQAAQEHYANDGSVEFLFIDTWERDENYKENVAAFIEKNKYPFEVLFDDEQDADGRNLAARYGVQGIPAKFILDQQGKIRYALTGSGSNADYIKLEMIELIEAAREPHPDAGAQSQTSFSLQGEVEGLGDQWVYLSTQVDGVAQRDSVKAIGGVFHFEKESPGTLLYFLSTGRSRFSLPIARGERVRIGGRLSDWSALHVEGAGEWPVWQEWQREWGDIHRYAGTLYQKADSLRKQGLDGTAVDEAFQELEERLFQTVRSIVTKYPSSEIVPFIIQTRYVDYAFPDKFAATYALLDGASRNSYYGRVITQAMEAVSKTAIGQHPAFSLPDVDGNPVSLADFRGKYVFVDFWASWCGPCRKENPYLVAAYEEYKGKGFEIVGISLDDKKENWFKAIEADGLEWVHLSDLQAWESSLVLEYGIKSIPMNFLVDPSGKVVAKNLRGEALRETLGTLL